MTENTDAKLVSVALNGDAESFGRLCEQYYPALVAIAYAQLADRDMAEDAAQEALMITYRDIQKLKQPERFAGWLTTICRNIAIDMAKARTRTRHVESLGPPAKSCYSEDNAVTVIREMILRLEPNMRDIIYLRYYAQMSYGQIARMLDISQEAVNGRLRRARERIRQAWQRQAATEVEP